MSQPSTIPRSLRLGSPPGSRFRRNRPTERAFTLVELLVVIAIIGILIAMMLPAIFAAIEHARLINCQNNVRQLSIAVQTHHTSHRKFPANWGTGTTSGGLQTKGQSWLTALLPLLDNEPLFGTIKSGETLGYQQSGQFQRYDNLQAAKTVVPTFRCPSDTGNGLSETQAMLPGQAVAVTNYKACAGSNWQGTASGEFRTRKADRGYGGRNADQFDGLDRGDGAICRGWDAQSVKPVVTTMSDIRDGATQTILIGESIPEFCNWSAWYWFYGSIATAAIPPNWPEVRQRGAAAAGEWQSNFGFMSRHRGVTSFGFCDGSARPLSDDIDLAVYRALATIDGSEVAHAER